MVYVAVALSDNINPIERSYFKAVGSTRMVSTIPHQDLKRLSYGTRKVSRCEEHIHVEEWIACPRCLVCFDAINDFASSGDSDRELSCLRAPTLEDEHMMIVGITQGWNTIRSRPDFDRSWERQAKFDEEVELQRITKPVERLAYFFIRYWWHYRSLPFEKRSPDMLPSFLTPTPTQLNNLHDAAIDICPFATFRHQLIADAERYRSDNFWQPFLTCLHFFWPFDFTDAIVEDSQTGLFRFSHTFRKAICEGDSWSLSMEFFDIFPEFHGQADQYDPEIITPKLGSYHQLKQRSILLHKQQCSAVATITEIRPRSNIRSKKKPKLAPRPSRSTPDVESRSVRFVQSKSRPENTKSAFDTGD